MRSFKFLRDATKVCSFGLVETQQLPLGVSFTCTCFYLLKKWFHALPQSVMLNLMNEKTRRSMLYKYQIYILRSVFLESLFDGIDLDTTITRATFERLNEDLFTGTLETVETALADAEMESNEVAHFTFHSCIQFC